MPKPPVVILSSIRWGWLWQRHQALADLFVRAGYPTVFVETTGIANPRLDRATLGKVVARLSRSRSRAGRGTPEVAGLTVYSPLVAPPTQDVFRRINRRFLVPRVVRDVRRMVGEEPLVVAYPPTRTTLDIARGLKPRLLLYDCCDDYEGFPGVPADIAETERELIGISDLVSCTSTPLLEKVRAHRPDAFLNGPGVDFEAFHALFGERPVGEVKTVCYFGHIGGRATDFSVLRMIAEAGFTLRLLGDPTRAEAGLLDAPGVDFRGEVSHAELPGALRGVDAFVIPYRVARHTESVSPSKTYECLATGKPVVATPLPAMVDLGEHVYLADTPERFVGVLRRLPEYETEEKSRARAEAAQRNSWEARFRELEAEVRRRL